jgi:acetyltransferase-like isoleucine patch superfamily enzyme
MESYKAGCDCTIDDRATVGYVYDEESEPAYLGDHACVRAGTIIYTDVVVGDDFNTGHNVLIREHTTMGDSVLVGTDTVVDGRVDIGNNASVQTGVYIPPETTIGDCVFIGPHAVFTNDSYPVRTDVPLDGPTIHEHVSIGANATILSGVTVGKRAFVAAGSVVTKDVPPDTLAYGVPATHEPLPPELTGTNSL